MIEETIERNLQDLQKASMKREILRHLESAFYCIENGFEGKVSEKVKVEDIIYAVKRARLRIANSEAEYARREGELRTIIEVKEHCAKLSEVSKNSALTTESG